MTRYARCFNVLTGEETQREYTPEEDVSADAAQAVDDQSQAALATEEQRLTAIRTNNRTAAIVTALTTKDDAGLIAAVAARYPSLAGDGLKAVTDIALALATIYRA